MRSFNWFPASGFPPVLATTDHAPNHGSRVRLAKRRSYRGLCPDRSSDCASNATVARAEATMARLKEPIASSEGAIGQLDNLVAPFGVAAARSNEPIDTLQHSAHDAAIQIAHRVTQARRASEGKPLPIPRWRPPLAGASGLCGTHCSRIPTLFRNSSWGQLLAGECLTSTLCLVTIRV